MSLEKEMFSKFLRNYIESNFDGIVNSVVNALKSRPDFHVHISLNVFLTDDSKHPEGYDNLSGQIVIRDLRKRKIPLDERSN